MPISGNKLLPPGEEYKATPDLIKAYQALVGSINWVAYKTWPDIAYDYSQLSKYVTNPTEKYIEAAKYLLRCLSGTKAVGLLY